MRKYDVISFDVFDTLVNRYVGKPKEIFTLMEHELCSKYGNKFSGFSQKRIQAEKEARNLSKYDEVTLEEIYACLDADNKQQLMLLEKTMEIELSCKNEEMYHLYNKFLQNGNTIVICSDMYLDRATIEDILLKNGYTGYKKLYLSSEIKKRKSDGKLYLELIHDLQINPKKVIHIGDNFKSDYLQAMKQGLSTYHYIRNKSQRINPKYSCSVLYGDMPKAFNNKYYWQQVGKYSLGNSLYGYTNWLINQFEGEKYDHIFFLSRDGYIMKKSLEIMASEELSLKCEYLYASRRSLIIPTLHLYQGYKNKCKIMFWKKHFTLREYISNFGLDYEKYRTQLRHIVKNELKLYDRSELETDELLSVYAALERKIEENSKHEYELLVQYLKQNNFSGKVAIVDTGWYGNLQNALEVVNISASLNADIHGYYIGIRDNCIYFEKQKMSGYLYFGKEHLQTQISEMRSTALVEAFYSKDEGSTKCYEKRDGKIIPVLKNNDLGETKCHILNLIQKSALERVKNLCSIKSVNLNGFKPEVYFYGFHKISIEPTLRDSWEIGRFAECNKLHGAGYYFIHPKRLKKDIYELNWKLGQLKRILKIKINYMKLYDLLDR